ncbi:MAG: RNA polymerase sigma-70 factor [Bacteroidota bacterium]
MFLSKRKGKNNEPDLTTSYGFEKAYKLYSKLLLNIAYNQLYDKTESENIVQDVFCRLWERKGEVKIEGPLKNYLIRAVKLAVFSYVRKKIGREQLDVQIHQNIPQHQNTVEEEVVFNDLIDKANSLVSQLPPRRQAIYRLCTEKLMSNKEIANELIISEKTVDSQLTKAVKFLRKNLS